MDPEEIPADALLSRHVDSPHKFSRAEQALLAGLFEFKGNEESLVWRKYLVSDADLHAVGCARQRMKREVRPDWTYEGAATARARDVRAVRTNFGNFRLEHTPEEADYHVSIFLEPAPGVTLAKSHKSELKMLVRDLFGNLDRHSCPE